MTSFVSFNYFIKLPNIPKSSLKNRLKICIHITSYYFIYLNKQYAQYAVFHSEHSHTHTWPVRLAKSILINGCIVSARRWLSAHEQHFINTQCWADQLTLYNKPHCDCLNTQIYSHTHTYANIPAMRGSLLITANAN